MKAKLYISILFCTIAVSTWAQTYKNSYTPSAQQEYEAIQSQQIMQVNAHEGTIYEPFSNTTPSEQSVVGAAQTTSNGPHRAKKDFDTGGDANQGPSPIGDAVLPLMLMAVAFGGVVYFRRRKALNS
ncbi:MAG: hypothetical protein IKP11_04865 [Paludibacteraceae bacterium]|nr:hypothetical protein [Paludibacteraceae bacterium]